MTFKIIFNSGSGSVEADSLSEFSYSESVPPLEPSDSSGGSSQVTFSAAEVEALKANGRFVNTRLLINNDVTINDEINGMISAKVSKVTITGGMASITADSALAKMNKDVVSSPVNTNLYDAVVAYCALAGVSPEFAGTLEADMVATATKIPAWKGNLWDKLKQLCSSTMVDGKPIEVVATFAGVTFRYALEAEIKIDDRLADYSVSVDSFEAATSISLPRTFSSYGENKVVYEMSNYDNSVPLEDRFKASIADSMQVEAGATVSKRFQIDATLDTINQPVCVSTITRTPPAPYAGTTGEYVIVGSDNLPIKPAQWIGLGGSLFVSLTENPGEIEVTVTAPPLSELEKEAGGMGLAPYSIGVESSGDNQYPAFWLTGTGVFYHQESRDVSTGAEPVTSKDAASAVDTVFLLSEDNYWTKAALSAQKAAGPSLSLSITTPADIPYSTGVGSTFYKDWNKFRIDSANYGVSEVSMTASPCASFSDFNNTQGAATFADFSALTIDPGVNPDQAMHFNEFTLVPLLRA